MYKWKQETLTLVHEHSLLSGDPVSDHHEERGGPVLEQTTADSFTSLKLYFYTCTVLVTQWLHTVAHLNTT